MQIEIAYAESQRVIRKVYELAPGARVADALELAALDPDFAGVKLADSPVGLYGKVVRADQALSDGDRIEIYRPLDEDPKIARRQRAKVARRRASGG